MIPAGMLFSRLFLRQSYLGVNLGGLMQMSYVKNDDPCRYALQ